MANLKCVFNRIGTEWLYIIRVLIHMYIYYIILILVLIPNFKCLDIYVTSNYLYYCLMFSYIFVNVVATQVMFYILYSAGRYL